MVKNNSTVPWFVLCEEILVFGWDTEIRVREAGNEPLLFRAVAN